MPVNFLQGLQDLTSGQAWLIQYNQTKEQMWFKYQNNILIKRVIQLPNDFQ